MKTFKGFTESETFSQLPDAFFHQLLHEIDEAAELKVTLYFLWRLEHMDGPFRALCESDFDVKELGLSADEIRSGLEKAVKRGSMLKSQHEADVFYFLNSPRGRAAAEAFAQGRWRESAQIVSTPLERPNIFRLYEENIGPITTVSADWLEDAEKTYSGEWVAEAIEEAVISNVRKIRYIESILKDWKENGRAKKQGGRDDKKSSKQNLDRKIEQLRKRTQE
ncbi:MAG TPA: DnaD domain protein [Anaerolineales bacterium]|nr:DnaD domain protein [Anaerolineales bacterium]